jgi:hypothetical protein
MPGAYKTRATALVALVNPTRYGLAAGAYLTLTIW